MPSHDAAAIAALIARYYKAWEVRAAAKRAEDEAAKQFRGANEMLTSVNAAFKIFDIDTAVDGVWKVVEQRIGTPLYAEAIEEGKRLLALTVAPVVQPQPSPEAEESSKEEEAQQAPENEGHEDEDVDETEEPSDLSSASEVTATVREGVLAGLRLAGVQGIKAAELRASYERQHGVKLHSKTIGMTLYRLSKEIPPLARREGRTWFFVETKDPGVSAPGQFVRRV